MLPTSGLFALLAPRKDEILAGAVAQGRIMASGSQPTLDMVKTAGLERAKHMLLDTLAPQCQALLDTAATMFPLIHGPRPEMPANDPAYIEWKDQFDEYIMDTIGQDALRLAGQDFIGEFLTESEIDEDAIRNAAAAKMAANMVRTAVSDRQPGQVLAEIGIVHDDLIKVAVVPAGGGAAPAGEPVNEGVARAHVERLVGAWAIKLGMADFTLEKATEVLRGAFDDDDFLPLSYIEVLGGTPADAPYFRAYHKAAGKDAVSNTANAAMMAALTGTLVEMPKDAPKPKKTKKSATVVDPVVPPPPPSVLTQAPTEAAGDPEDDIADVFKLVKQHSSDSVDALAAFVGKSRAWMNNVIQGKTACKASAAQRNALRTHLETRKAGLQAAIDRLC
jgi:hypothetical protein